MNMEATGTWGYRATVHCNAVAAAEQAIEREEPYIDRLARWLSEGDAMLADDLAQVGRITLWDIDPSRFGESDRGYQRAAIRYAMVRAKYRPRVGQGGADDEQ